MKNSESPVKHKFEIRFERAIAGDIPELTEIMTRAFDDDSRRFRAKPEGGGPPGYDTGEFLRAFIIVDEDEQRKRFGGFSKYYKILKNDKAVGAILVFINHDDNNEIGNMFVDPDYQNQGIGTRAIEFIEKTFPQTKKWTVGTPEWATRNLHFYKKCGYSKLRKEYNKEEGFMGFVFEKVMENNSTQ